jgi:hypothetical protein
VDGFRATLTKLWTAQGQLTGAEAASLLKLYEEAPENSARSSMELAYWTMLGVSLMAAAVNAANPDGPDVAGWVCSGSIELHGSTDEVLNPPSPGTRIIDPRDMPPPREQEVAEIAAERASLEILRSTEHPYAVMNGRIQELSEAREDELSPLMPRFLALRDWEDAR